MFVLLDILDTHPIHPHFPSSFHPISKIPHTHTYKIPVADGMQAPKPWTDGGSASLPRPSESLLRCQIPKTPFPGLEPYSVADYCIVEGVPLPRLSKPSESHVPGARPWVGSLPFRILPTPPPPRFPAYRRNRHRRRRSVSWPLRRDRMEGVRGAGPGGVGNLGVGGRERWGELLVL